MKTLIVYASKHGCTEKCAQNLADTIGTEVVLSNLKSETPDLANYDGVVIGAPVYAGSVPAVVKKFHTDNLDLLKDKKLGLFICCGTVDKGQEMLEAAYPQELRNLAVISKSFGGAVSLEKQNFLIRTLLKNVLKLKESFKAIDSQAITEFAQAWGK